MHEQICTTMQTCSQNGANVDGQTYQKAIQNVAGKKEGDIVEKLAFWEWGKRHFQRRTP
jgi:hypothetical protein